jgi:hypothetical protein
MRYRQAKDALVLRGRDGSIVGFGLGVRNGDQLQVGPVVAPDGRRAFALIHRLVKDWPGRIRVDVPSHHEVLIRKLRESGFVLERIPPTMVLHVDHVPPRNGTLYAIAGQAYG